MNGFAGSFVIAFMILISSHLSVDSDFNETIRYTGIGLMIFTAVFYILTVIF